jgi:DNA helicase IV
MRSQLRSQVSEGNSNNELTIENRRLSDENRTIKREIENIKRTQASQNHNFENQKKRLVEDYEKKIKTAQESCEREKKR